MPWRCNRNNKWTLTISDIELGKISGSYTNVTKNEEAPDVEAAMPDGKVEDENEATKPANGDVLSDTSDIKVSFYYFRLSTCFGLLYWCILYITAIVHCIALPSYIVCAIIEMMQCAWAVKTNWCPQLAPCLSWGGHFIMMQIISRILYFTPSLLPTISPVMVRSYLFSMDHVNMSYRQDHICKYMILYFWRIKD